MSSPVNQLRLEGTVTGPVQSRLTPAGIPIHRFTLEHESRQVEAGMSRDARCRMAIVASGEALSSVVREISAGTQVLVEGFITRSSFKDEDFRIVLHAQAIELLK